MLQVLLYPLARRAFAHSRARPGQGPENPQKAAFADVCGQFVPFRRRAAAAFQCPLRQAKKDNNLEITIKRDIEPVYFYGEFEGYQNNGEYLTINGEQVIAMPPYAIYGLMRYVHKYVGLSI